MRVLVVGIMNYCMADDFLDNIRVFNGLEMTLVPEPVNAYDENAVMVFYREKVIGYVAREQAEFVKRLILKYGYKKQFVLGKGFLPDYYGFRDSRSHVGCNIDVAGLVENKKKSTRVAMLYKEVNELDKRFDWLLKC